MKGVFRFGLPIIKLSIDGKEVDMLLDTGFNGQLMLPQKLIDKLRLKQIGISDYMTASGEGKLTKVYKGIVNLIDKKMNIVVLSTDADFSLAGMELLHDYR